MEISGPEASSCQKELIQILGKKNHTYPVQLSVTRVIVYPVQLSVTRVIGPVTR
jgi:hypothetical protein